MQRTSSGGRCGPGRPAVNILLHGPPGTGKTEFLPDRGGEGWACPLFSVGERDGRGGEPNRVDRLADLSLAQSLLARDENALLLFDEMADLLFDSGWTLMRGGVRRATRDGSKLFMNRLLEKRARCRRCGPANTGDHIPEVLLRRMKFAPRAAPSPAAHQGADLWSRQLARNDIEAEPGDALALATDPPSRRRPASRRRSPPTARLTGGDIDFRAARSAGARPGRSAARGPVQGVPVRFDLSLMRSDTDSGPGSPTG